MNKTPLNLFLLKGVLNFKPDNSVILDMIEQDNPDNPMLKNVCARIHVSLAENLEETCAQLKCSKRRFIEMAIANALDEFNNLAEEYDMFGEQERDAQLQYEIEQQKQKGNH